MNLVVLPEVYGICRLAPDADIPAWALQGSFHAITRTADELSIVCPQSSVPPKVQCEGEWRMLKVAAVLDFALTGVLVSIAGPLAEAGISIFAISTFDTDYLLVKTGALAQAVDTLRAAGHHVSHIGRRPG